MSEINADLLAQVEALFTGNPPREEAFDDTTPVTVEITKGQAYTVRALLRMDANAYLQTLEMKQMFGELTEQDHADVNDSFEGTLALEAAFEAVAPDADYARETETQADYALTV